METPHFLDVQIQAFERLLQPDIEGDRRDVGLERIFKEIFPIDDVNGNYSLEFQDYSLGEPKYSVDECMERDMTYAAPLKATLRLVLWEDLGDGERRPADILEKEVYLGDLPLLTEHGTFVVNGAERVIVSQLHRSPGVVFEENVHPNGTRLFSARIIPFRGSWVEFTLDIHDVIHVHIDKRKKFPATALLRALGHGTDADILEMFYEHREALLGEISEDRTIRREVIGTPLVESILDAEFEGESRVQVLGSFDPAKDEPMWLADDVTAGDETLARMGERLDDTLSRRFKEAGIEEVPVFDDPAAFVARRGEELTDDLYDRLLRAGVERIEVFSSAAFIPLRGSFEDLTMRRDWSMQPMLAADVLDPKTGKVLSKRGDDFTLDLFTELRGKRVREALVFTGGPRGESPLIKNTLAKDPTKGEAEALRNIYSLVRPGEAPNIETARTALDRLFFNPKRYDLGRVGRHKVNHRLRDVYRLLDIPMPSADTTVLAPSDFVAIVRYLVELSEGRGYTDDIDHLGNRRVRSIGELIANQFSVGLSRMARLVRERMSINSDPDKMSIDDLVNARTVSAVIQAFFGSSQLSQFMDQTNPLAELTHKRRLSALGPGGLSRERAGFEVRDVHYSHYGRMCPIETPEGPNIGLITSMTTFSRLNELGFLETPYRKVVDGIVTDEIEWLSASEEEDYSVAQANAVLAADGSFVNDLVLCRRRDDYPLLPHDEIDFMDVAPDQLVAVSPALIPFLEHDDANRALMGSNMQRQAVPLLFPDAPLAGTGLEEKVAADSAAVITARRGGKVTRVTAEEIVIDTGARKGAKQDEPLARLSQYDRYRLKKFWRTNQDTAINQRPIVQTGQAVKRGDVIADGAATDFGALALGRNVTVAFMPWYGHNFEDAIVISEGLVKNDAFTSVHIQELELHVRDTKRGTEEITVEIPNVAEEALVDLDERGIVRVGASVKTGDILVGKITPKGETELSPEEKLLTAIFGEKAKDVKDSSLRVPPGVEGTVIDVKIFSRRIDDPLLEREHGERIARLRETEREEITRITEARDEELQSLLEGQTVALLLRRGTIEPLLKEGSKLSKKAIAGLDLGEVDLSTLKVKNDVSNRRARKVIEDEEAKRRIERIRERTEEGIDRVFQADELSPGVVQLVKVYLAEKRKISVGDKMAGRHGNKGIIARVVPEEDMECRPDPGDTPGVGGSSARLPCPDPRVPGSDGGRNWRPAQARGRRMGRTLPRTRCRGSRGRRGDGATIRARNPGVRGRFPAEEERPSEGTRAESGRLSDHWSRQDCQDVPAGLRPLRARGGARRFWCHHGGEAEGVRLAGCRSAGGPEDDFQGTGRSRRRAGTQGRDQAGRQDDAAGRPYGRAVRRRRDRGRDLHDEALAPGGRQDPRALHRAVQPGDPAAAGRKGPVRRPAFRRDGGVGARGVRRGAHAPGDADGQVRRRDRTQSNLRGDSEGREPAQAGSPGKLQRAGQGASGARTQRDAGQRRRQFDIRAVKHIQRQRGHTG